MASTTRPHVDAPPSTRKVNHITPLEQSNLTEEANYKSPNANLTEHCQASKLSSLSKSETNNASSHLTDYNAQQLTESPFRLSQLSQLTQFSQSPPMYLVEDSQNSPEPDKLQDLQAQFTNTKREVLTIRDTLKEIETYLTAHSEEFFPTNPTKQELSNRLTSLQGEITNKVKQFQDLQLQINALEKSHTDILTTQESLYNQQHYNSLELSGIRDEDKSRDLIFRICHNLNIYCHQTDIDTIKRMEPAPGSHPRALKRTRITFTRASVRDSVYAKRHNIAKFYGITVTDVVGERTQKLRDADTDSTTTKSHPNGSTVNATKTPPRHPARREALSKPLSAPSQVREHEQAPREPPNSVGNTRTDPALTGPNIGLTPNLETEQTGTSRSQPGPANKLASQPQPDLGLDRNSTQPGKQAKVKTTNNYHLPNRGKVLLPTPGPPTHTQNDNAYLKTSKRDHHSHKQRHHPVNTGQRTPNPYYRPRHETAAQQTPPTNQLLEQCCRNIHELSNILRSSLAYHSTDYQEPSTQHHQHHQPQIQPQHRPVSRHVSPPRGEPGHVSPAACEPGHVSPSSGTAQRLPPGPARPLRPAGRRGTVDT